MLKLYCKITGDDYQMLKNETPDSKKKVALLATCLFIPVLIWIIIGFFLVNNVLQGSVQSAILTALVSAIIVFLIERSVIMSSNSKSIAAFRIILGFCVAFLGSIAIDELTFKNDIDNQVALIRQNKIKDIEKKRKQFYQTEIDAQDLIVKKLSSEYHSAIDDVSREADGTGGSRVRGVNGITKVKQLNAKLKKEDYENANNHLINLKNKADLKIKEDIEKFDSNFNEHSLLIRIRAMFDLVCQDIFMCAIYIVFSVFLFILEFLVVFFKLNSKETNYESKLKLIEQIGKERMQKIANKDASVFDPDRSQPDMKQARAMLQKPYPSVFKN